jgi:MYXO-CTERM domain-containing protein
MSTSINKTLSTLLVAAGVSTAHAEVLSFDDLSGLQFFVTNYRGFQFGSNDINTTAWFHTDQANAPSNPKSGATYLATDFRLYTGGLFEATQAISRSTSFAFDGAWFAGDSAVRYQLYKAGNLVFTSANSAALTAVPQFVSSGYTGLVDSVVIVGKQGFYALDDFTYNSAPAVPEPQAAAMWLVGLLGLGALARRRKFRR